MERNTVKIRLNSKDYKEMICRELGWKEDIEILRSCRSEKIDQKTMKKVEYYDPFELRAKRFAAMMSPESVLDDKGNISFDEELLKGINGLTRKDFAVVAEAWNELNEVTEAEKSGSVGKDRDEQAPHGESVDGEAQGHDNKDLVVGD